MRQRAAGRNAGVRGDLQFQITTDASIPTTGVTIPDFAAAGAAAVLSLILRRVDIFDQMQRGARQMLAQLLPAQVRLAVRQLKPSHVLAAGDGDVS